MKKNDTIYDKMKCFIFMEKILMDKSNYLTEKQASNRYGRSRSWFQKRRHFKMPPFWKKFENTNRVYYEVKETDRWFIENMKNQEI